MIADNPSTDARHHEDAPRRERTAPRLWPAFAILLLQLVAIVLTVSPTINNTARFGYMMLGPAVCALLFACWLLFLSRLRWRDRGAILVGIILAGVIAGQLIDNTMGVALWIYGVPLAMFLTTALLWIGKQWTPSQRTLVVVSLVAVGWSLFLPARLGVCPGTVIGRCWASSVREGGLAEFRARGRSTWLF